MEKLAKQVNALKNDTISRVIAKRIKEFQKAGKLSGRVWFSELCFCILTANSKAKTAIEIEKQLGVRGFCENRFENIRDCIKKNGHRFHNNKASFICVAREHLDIKEKVLALTKNKSEHEIREWVANTIKGLGYKEASHFLRNVGFSGLAIVDRHIINLLAEHGLPKPKAITKKVYLDYENKLRRLAEDVSLSLAELDLYLWYIKTGEVLK
ncbi:MAG: N-glycosylase/DNA lyase [Nanoarchaeota archaeon]